MIRKHYNGRAICAYNAERATVLLPEIAGAIGTGQVQGVLLYSPRTARLFEQLLREAALQGIA